MSAQNEETNLLSSAEVKVKRKLLAVLKAQGSQHEGLVVFGVHGEDNALSCLGCYWTKGSLIS